MSGGITWRRFGQLQVPTMTQGGGSLFPLGVGAECDGTVERIVWGMLKEAGKAKRPVTVQEIIDAAAEAGIKVRDEVIRETARHLLMDHLLPVGSGSAGLFMCTCPADIAKAREHLVSRRNRIDERIAALDELEAVCVRQELEPIAKRWDHKLGVSKIMAGRVLGKFGKQRRRHKELADANRDKAPAPALEVTL